VVALGAALGFFFLPAYALLLEMCSELAGRASAGYATGLLMLAGNAGGVVTIVAMDAVKGTDGSYRPSVWLLLGLLMVAIALSLVVSETFQRKPA
jgi:nitrate/nitrite transporter NarK